MSSETAHKGSDSENPVIDSPSPKGDAPLTNQDWWPNQVDIIRLHPHSPQGNPLGDDFNYAEEFSGIDVDALKPTWSPHHHLAGLVARRLRPLRRLFHPDELARRWHLPHLRRPRWRRSGSAALRPAEQLAGQRQPGQGATAAVAGQEEVRQQDLVGRPAAVAGNVALESMGFETFGFAFGREYCGSPRKSSSVKRANGWAPTSATRASAICAALRRDDDGPDLRQSRRARRQAGPNRRRDRHPRDLWPDGDERRGNGRADRRWPHLRQDARRWRRRPGRPRARGRSDRTAGARLEEPLRQRRRQGRHHQRPGGGVDPDSDQVGQLLPGDAVRLRMGADQEPRWRMAVHREGRRRCGHHPGPVRRTGSRPDDAGHRHLDAGSPIYADITRRWLDHPEELADAFAKAWYKLLHRDMGPVSRSSDPGFPSRNCGRTRCRRSTTSWSTTRTSQP